MKASDRTILLALAGIGLFAAFWMLVISPKRSEVGELGDQVAEVRASVDALNSEAAAGEAARDKFPKHYERMVVLGKAVPADDEEADLIVGLQRIGEGADVEFRSITLGTGGELPLPEVVRPNPITGEDPTQTTPETSAPGDASAQPTAAAPPGATPTEASAASLPIGATVGPAGLGVMPWDIKFDGDFFDLNRVFDQIDYLVRFDGKGDSKVVGRLVTVDGFNLKRLDDDEVPRLEAAVAVRSFVVPSGEGVTLGATPEGPATTPVSSEVTP